MEQSTLNIGEQVAFNFFAGYNLRCERFTDQEMRQGKTPDFRVFKGPEFVLYGEAKHIQEDTWLDDQLKAAPPMTIVGGSRHDPAFNRLSSHIHQAAKQFQSVNPSREYPNVLVFTSSDRGCRFTDLISTLTGNFYAEGGAVEPIYKSVSDGRIKAEKYTIDLYVFKDDFPGGLDKEHIYFQNKGSKHYLRLCELLGSDHSLHNVITQS
jgi:hypothetical protein